MSNKREKPERDIVNSTISLNIEPCSSSDLNMAAKEETEKNNMEKTEEKGIEDTKNSVPFYKLFELADTWDITLMSIGTLGSIANGLAIRIMTILFGTFLNLNIIQTPMGESIISEPCSKSTLV